MAQSTTSGTTGTSRRRKRPAAHWSRLSGVRRAEVQDAAFEYPPTKKKTGITWNSQVRYCVAGCSARMLRSSSSPAGA